MKPREDQDFEVFLQQLWECILSQTLRSVHITLFSIERSLEIPEFFFGSRKMGKTYEGHEDDELLWKFQIEFFESSPDGFYWLDVNIDENRSFSQLSSVEKSQQVNLGTKFSPKLPRAISLQGNTEQFQVLCLSWSQSRFSLWELEFAIFSWSLERRPLIERR